MKDIYLPDLGQDIEEATISFWYIEEGERVEEGSDIVEITTDKSTFNVQAPCSGIIAEILAGEGARILAGSILARIEEDS